MTSLLNDLKVTGVDVDVWCAAGPLSADELPKTDAFWRACHYLAAGMDAARCRRRRAAHHASEDGRLVHVVPR